MNLLRIDKLITDFYNKTNQINEFVENRQINY